MGTLQKNPNREKSEKFAQSPPGTRPGGTSPAPEDGLITVNAGRKVTLLNTAAEALTGWTQREVSGKDLASVFVLIDAETRSALENPAVKALLDGELAATTRPTILITRSGAEKLVSICAAPLANEKGEVQGVALIVQDLEEGGEDAANPAQGLRVETLGHMAAGMAPEIHRLTGVITDGSHSMIARLDQSIADSPEFKEIQRASAHLDSLVDQMLACARESLALKPELVDLNSAVSDLYGRIRERMGADSEVVTLLGPATAQVHADPEWIEQVILDLALNVTEALPRAGKLVIEIAKIEKSEDSEPPEVPYGSYVLLAIAGNAPTVDPVPKAPASSKLFTGDPENQVSESRLARAYHIVQQSGGYLCVSRQPGNPDSFRVFLPRVETTVEDSASSEATQTILVVEDETEVRILVRDFLISNGYKVLDTADGAEALRVSAAYDGPIHIMLTDLIMPGLAGHEVAERLASARPKMQVLYMSGCLDSDFLRLKNLQQEVSFIQKPFPLNTLIDKVREVLAARKGAPSPRE